MTRIQLRLGLVLALGVAGIVLLAGLLAERSLRERHAANLERSLEARARLIAALVGDTPITVARRVGLEALAERASRAAGSRVSLIAGDGTVVADSGLPTEALPAVEDHSTRPEVVAALAGGVGSARRLSRTLGQPLLYLAVPAHGSGVVRLAMRIDAAEAEAAFLRRTLGVTGLLAVALALALGAVGSRRLLRPLFQMRDVLSGLAAGDYEKRLPDSARDELGEIARAINRLTDQLRERLTELASEKEQLRAVLLGMVEGVLVVDREARVVLANPRFRELFGVWGEVAGRSAFDVVRRTEVEAALLEAAAGREPVVGELQAGTDGDRMLVMHAVRFPATGQHLGTVAVFHEVTELRRLEQMRRDFVANVSHELKTPLTAIRGFAETLQSEDLGADQRKQYLDVVIRHAGRLAALIEDLLELSRIEGRQQPLDIQEVAVAQLLRGLLRDLAPRLAARALEAHVTLPDETRVRADRRALEQVLINLLDNAVKYTDPGGRIAVSVSDAGEHVRIDVCDSGVGIPEVDLPRIFERFYRVDKARSRDLGGTGLGLSIVKHLVQAMGGEVFVESIEGESSTFSLLLPRV